MRWLIIICIWLFPSLAFSQSEEEGKGMLTRFLESSLSSAGRVVEVNGLRGAISSEATIQEIKISDDQGIWLTLSNITLNWNRLSALRGNIIINQLSAETITMPRLPRPESTPEAMKAEATPFSLPELPVSINIQKLSADRINLGEPVLGRESVMSLESKLVLQDGSGEVVFKATQLKGPEGKFHFDASFSNKSRNLKVDLKANEAANGIISGLAHLPGKPEIELTVLGEGKIEDFKANISLASNGIERLSGQVILFTEAADTPKSSPKRVIRTDISGNMAPLFAPEFKKFFGQSVALNTEVHLYPDGRTKLDNLYLNSAALNLKGNIAISADGVPENFDIKLHLADPGGDQILLPTSGGQTIIKRAELTAGFDAAKGEHWTLSGTIEEFQSELLNAGWLSVSGAGAISQSEPKSVTGSLSLELLHLDLKGDAITQATGDSGTLSGNFIWQKNEGTSLKNFYLKTGDVEINGNAIISGVGADLIVDGSVSVIAPDISRFSGIAGRDIKGKLNADIDGSLEAMAGAFDINMTATGSNLSIDDPKFDSLITGDTKLLLSAARNYDGLVLRNFTLDAKGLDLNGQGQLDSVDGTAQLSATLHETSNLLENISGPTKVIGNASFKAGNLAFNLDATAPGEILASIDGSKPKGAGIEVVLDITAGSVETFLPALPGTARVHAQLHQLDQGWGVTLDAKGPFETQTQGSGIIDLEGSKNTFSITGTLPLAAANRKLVPNSIQGMATYDLELKGPANLSSVTGIIRTNGSRFTLPSMRASLSDINSTISLRRGVAEISATTEFSGGGEISVGGSIDLVAPFSANLPIKLKNLGYRDGQFLETSVDGTMQIVGPLTGGANIVGDFVLGQTNIQISSSALAGVGAIPKIRHVGEPSVVRQTRQKAGLIKTSKGNSSSSSTPFGIDLSVAFGERLSVRGMGLDADFNGGVKLQGNTNNIVTQGEIDLIRGRMDFLSKTFEISEGIVRLEGDLLPWLRIEALSAQPDATISIILEGRLDDPKIILESDPELPEDEVLSQLLFGRDLSSISALQAAQLAAALASLSGNGPAMPRLGKNTGLDDLSLTFDDAGTPGLRAGKYINENIYTEIEANSSGKSSISLNLDVSDNLTVRGKVDSDSDSGIGLFFQRDY